MDLHVFRSAIRRRRAAGRINHQDKLCAGSEPIERLSLDLGEGVARRDDLRDEVRRNRPVPLGPADCLGLLGRDERGVGRANSVGIASQ